MTNCLFHHLQADLPSPFPLYNPLKTEAGTAWPAEGRRCCLAGRRDGGILRLGVVTEECFSYMLLLQTASACKES